MSPTRAADMRRELGRRGERIAEAHLRRVGFSTIARNERSTRGEIDLIVFDGRTLVFVEVKTRRMGAARARASGGRATPGKFTQPESGDPPLARLQPRQRAPIRRLARAWLAERRAAVPYARELRFDAIGVLIDAHDDLVRIDHIEAAW
jgi:putative endonuclease